jgi:hypothetical protein
MIMKGASNESQIEKMASMRVQEIQRKFKNTGFSGSQKSQAKLGSQHMLTKKPPMNQSGKYFENS